MTIYSYAEEKAAKAAADAILQGHGRAIDETRGLVPLPERKPTDRVIPELPFSAYSAMLRL